MVMEIRAVRQGVYRKSLTFAAQNILYMYLTHSIDMSETLLNQEIVCFLSRYENHTQAWFLSALIKNGTEKKMKEN